MNSVQQEPEESNEEHDLEDNQPGTITLQTRDISNQGP